MDVVKILFKCPFCSHSRFFAALSVVSLLYGADYQYGNKKALGG